MFLRQARDGAALLHRYRAARADAGDSPGGSRLPRLGRAAPTGLRSGPLRPLFTARFVPPPTGHAPARCCSLARPGYRGRWGTGMKRLLNTLYVTSEGAWLRKDGANVVVEVEGSERGRAPLHLLGARLSVSGKSAFAPQLHCSLAADVRHCAITYLGLSGRFLRVSKARKRGISLAPPGPARVTTRAAHDHAPGSRRDNRLYALNILCSAPARGGHPLPRRRGRRPR